MLERGGATEKPNKTVGLSTSVPGLLLTMPSLVAYLPSASSEQVSRLNRVCCEERWFGQSPERSFVDSVEVCTEPVAWASAQATQ